MRFIGIDLTSAFAQGAARAIDVAILSDELEVSFALARWPTGAEVVARSAPAFRAMLEQAVPPHHRDVVWAIDGPQGLSKSGAAMRLCERQLAAPGRTPDTLPLPESTQPFHGFIRSSVDLFAALAGGVFDLKPAGLDRITANTATLFEVFPGAEWSVLAGARLSKKGSAAGRAQRRDLFRVLGVRGLPVLPTPDQNDALVGAYVAWCSRHRPQNVSLVGMPPYRGVNREIREGLILHATGEARVTGWESSVESDAPEAEGQAVEEWSGTTLALRITDSGLIHGQEPENSWLVARRNYDLEFQNPYPRLRASLTWSPTFSGGRGWTIRPTVKQLLRSLGSDIDLPTRSNPLTLPIELL